MVKALLFSLPVGGANERLHLKVQTDVFRFWLWVLRINDTMSLFTIQSSYNTPEKYVKVSIEDIFKVLFVLWCFALFFSFYINVFLLGVFFVLS